MRSICCALLVAGCGGNSADTCVVTSLAVTANPATVVSGQTTTITSVASSVGLCTGAVTWTVSPAGATLTPSDSSTMFSATTPNVYTVTATDGDDTSVSGSTVVTVGPPCATPNGTTITHSADITADETWAGGGITHLVPSQLQVRAPATLTIEPCAIVSFGAGQGIEVVGDSANSVPAKLVAAGNDDVFGFVELVATDSDQPWGSLQGDNEQSLIELDHTQLIGAGAGGTSTRQSAIAMNGAGYAVAAAPVLTANSLVIDHPQGGAVFLDTNAAFTATSTQLTVIGAPDYPIAMNMMALGTIPVFTGQQDTHDDVLVIGASPNVFADLTITNRMPVRIQTAGDLVVAPPPASNLTEVTLTIQPGTILRFEGTRMIFGQNGHGAANTSGILVATGTPQQPIVFTSGAATPAPGDWGGLYLLTAPGSQIQNAAIDYAGGPSGIVSTNCRPQGQPDDAALIIGSDSFVPTIDLVRATQIIHSAGFGIDAIWTAATDDTPDLATDNTFGENVGCNQTFNGLTTGSCPVGGGCVN